MMVLVQSTTYGSLHLGQRDVADSGVEIAPTGAPATWRIRLTRFGGCNLTQDLATNMPKVQDLLLVLGYAWG